MKKLWAEWLAIIVCELVCAGLVAAGAPVFVFFPVALGLPMLLVVFVEMRSAS